MAVIGPALRKDAKAFMDAVRALPPDELPSPPVSVHAGGKDIPVPDGAFSLQSRYLVGGELVDVITVDDVIVTVRKYP
jgi:valyl-tRNA synthetase